VAGPDEAGQVSQKTEMRIATVITILGLAACAGGGPVKVDTERAKACCKDGDAAYKAKSYDRAIEHYTNAVKANPEYAEPYYWRGNSWRMIAADTGSKTRGDEALVNALKDYELAVNRNPMHYEAFFNRACIYMALARPKEAVADFMHCTTLRTRDGEPHLYLGDIYEKWFEDKKLIALDHYEKYVERGGSDPDVLEKVRQYRDLKKQLQPPPTPKGATADDEKKAAELHKQALEFARQGKKDDAYKALDECLTKYAATKYVKDNGKALDAMRRAFAPKR